MKNLLYISFDIDATKEYPCVLDEPYIDNFNEQIDSMSILIDNVETPINFNRPYHFCKIVNKGVDLTIQEMIDENRPTSLTKQHFQYKPELLAPYHISAVDMNIVPNQSEIFILNILFEGEDYSCKCECMNVDEITHQILYVILEYHKSNYDGFKWNNKNYIIMLLDNYVETETDIFNHIYKYQLNLMNVVKLLEKIQCPNLVITHSLINGSKTIWYYINHYMKNYSPKIKISEDGETWDYKYLFKWDNLNIAPFNSTIAADMQMNSPSLREVITNLMLQVGCIPTMEYRTLKFINFREEQSEFDYSHGITMTTKSGASDSYANVLISQPTQVLDTTNEVISEKIGFRDDKNCLIKQTENLKLQTRFPIYNIKKVMLQYDIPKYYFWPSYIYNVRQDTTRGTYPIIGGSESLTPHTLKINPVVVEKNVGQYELLINYLNVGEKMIKGTLKNLKAHLCYYDSTNDKYNEIEVLSTGDTEWHLNYDDNSSSKRVDATETLARELLSDGTFGPIDRSYIVTTFITEYNYYIYLSFSDNFNLSSITHIWYECDFYNEFTGKWMHQFVPIRTLAPVSSSTYTDIRAVTLMGYDVGVANDSITYSNFYYNISMEQKTSFKGGWQVDITSCFVEQSKRALLNTNFKEMTEDSSIDTLEELSKYIYGTVGYVIGGTEITGFSNMYSQVQGWWSLTYTYFDNILKFIDDHNLGEKVAPSEEDAIAYSEKYGNMPVFVEGLYFTNNQPVIASDKSKYLFDITYQPLNSFKFKLTKKQDTNIPLEVQQLNQSAEGLSEYSRLIKNNQDIINRVGNEILFIPQTITDFSYLNNLNSLYNNKYTIFQRKIQLHEDYIECLYSASEKFVMQNYFTSIIQKYRAYQYVDYNQSVVRKENDTIYCLLSSKTYYNGDDKIYWETTDPSILLSGILPSNNSFQICYNIKYGLNEEYEDEYIKNETSVLIHETGFAVVYQDYDNISAGPYILEELTPSQFWAVNPDSLPGIVQKWQIWGQEAYNDLHKVSYANRIKISDLDLSDVIKFPILVDSETPLLFTLQTNKQNHNYEFYKDNAEVINQTVQFEYYCDSDEIEFTKNFIKKCRLVNQLPNNIEVNKIYLVDEDEELYETKSAITRTEIPFDSSLYSVGVTNNGIAYIRVNWENISGAIEGKKIILSCLNNSLVYDFIAFKYKSENTDYYLTLNDTKSNEVWYFSNDNDLFTIKECDNGTSRYLKND